MRAFAIAAFAGAAAAAPNYYGEYPAPASSSTPAAAYPVSSSTPAGYGYGHVSTPAYTSTPVKPTSTPCTTSTPAGYVSSSTPAGYPVTTSAPVYTTKTVYSTSLITITSCAEYVKNCPAHSTVVVTTKIPVSTTVCPVETTPVYTKPSKPVEKPSKPAAETTPCESSVTYTVTVPSKSGTPYYPIGTGSVPAPPVGTGAAHSSAYVKPSSYPPQFTGAASHAKVGGFVAGVGAVAALFL